MTELTEKSDLREWSTAHMAKMYEHTKREAAREEINGSGIRPMEFNVLVLPKEVKETTSGGVFLPETAKEKEEFGRMEGILVAVSPMAFAFEDWPAEREHEKPRVGDRVIFSKYNGSEVTGQDGRKYWLMKDRSIAGVMTDE